MTPEWKCCYCRPGNRNLSRQQRHNWHKSGGGPLVRRLGGMPRSLAMTLPVNSRSSWMWSADNEMNGSLFSIVRGKSPNFGEKTFSFRPITPCWCKVIRVKHVCPPCLRLPPLLYSQISRFWRPNVISARTQNLAERQTRIKVCSCLYDQLEGRVHKLNARGVVHMHHICNTHPAFDLLNGVNLFLSFLYLSRLTLGRAVELINNGKIAFKISF